MRLRDFFRSAIDRANCDTNWASRVHVYIITGASKRVKREEQKRITGVSKSRLTRS